MKPLFSWFLLLAAIIHVIEEYLFDWVRWTSRFVPNVTLNQFIVINALFLLLCVLAIVIPSDVLKLSIAALVLINLPFHLLPAIRFQQYTPGLASALLLYPAVGFSAYIAAWKSGNITPRQLMLSILLGMGWMGVPLIFQAIRLLMSS